MTPQDARYPIGEFSPPPTIEAEQRLAWIEDIEALPGDLIRVADRLTPDRLDSPYRAHGWTCRQVIHHLADSHLNAYVRCKWALTEDCPTIKDYREERWADLDDYRDLPVSLTLEFLDIHHQRWSLLMRGLDERQWAREFVHPETGPWPLDRVLGLYVWHGRHHLAQITGLGEREGWNLPASRHRGDTP